MKRQRTSNRNFRKTARRTAPANYWTPSRGGIRF